KEIILPSFVEVDLSGTDDASIFDTCPLKIYNHLDPQLRQFHNPQYNPKACWGVIYNDHDTKYIADPWIILPSEEPFRCDIIESQCSNGISFSSNESYLHMQIYETGEREQHSPMKSSSLPSSRDERPNVFILLLDSVSSHMSKRSLPQSLAYLKAELGAVQMEFLNKLGRNSRPNAFPLFFGKSDEGGSRALVGQPPIKPDWDHRKKCKEYLDKYSYDLEEYRLHGY
ncbi:hypothetical protein OSTOST_21472, partial [Ostertagia ostertagi]